MSSAKLLKEELKPRIRKKFTVEINLEDWEDNELINEVIPYLREKGCWGFLAGIARIIENKA